MIKRGSRFKWHRGGWPCNRAGCEGLLVGGSLLILGTLFLKVENHQNKHE